MYGVYDFVELSNVWNYINRELSSIFVHVFDNFILLNGNWLYNII